MFEFAILEYLWKINKSNRPHIGWVQNLWYGLNFEYEMKTFFYYSKLWTVKWFNIISNSRSDLSMKEFRNGRNKWQSNCRYVYVLWEVLQHFFTDLTWYTFSNTKQLKKYQNLRTHLTLYNFNSRTWPLLYWRGTGQSVRFNKELLIYIAVSYSDINWKWNRL